MASGELFRQAEVGDAGGDLRINSYEFVGRPSTGDQLLAPVDKAPRLLGLDELERLVEHGLQPVEKGLSHYHRAAAAAAGRARRGGVVGIVDEVDDGLCAVGEVKAPLLVVPGRDRRLYYLLHHVGDRAHHVHDRSRVSTYVACEFSIVSLNEKLTGTGDLSTG